jgi:hypothetical protein
MDAANIDTGYLIYYSGYKKGPYYTLAEEYVFKIKRPSMAHVYQHLIAGYCIYLEQYFYFLYGKLLTHSDMKYIAKNL